ncbi:MAG: uracil-DNA glycosylase [Clostridia bacterium]|nr:uracil-DNA glycosylase [Clostridia bacterium]
MTMHEMEARCRKAAGETWPEKTVVFGEGNEHHPAVMLIGEAPGEQESLQGRPFVGKAGKNLDQFLDVLQLNRWDIRISNVVKIRPTKISPKGRMSNRPPTKEEIAFFAPYLYEEILLVQPRMLVTLGNTALHAIVGDATIGSCHGQVMQTVIKAGDTEAGFSVFPLYHPASIIYNRGLAQVYQEDLLILRRVLEQGEPSFFE